MNNNESDKSSMSKAHDLIEKMEKEKTLFSKEERDFIVNYAFQTNDLSSTEEHANVIASREIPFSDIRDVAEREIEENIVTEEIIKKYELFKTTKEINLEDGTYIKKGTEFREEGFNDNKYTLHFCEESENKYTNETAEYEFLLSELKEFSLPVELKQQFQDEHEAELGSIFDDLDINTLNPIYYAISNNNSSYPKLNSLVAFDPHDNYKTEASIYSVTSNYPNLDSYMNNEEREFIVKEEYKERGLIEHVDFEFVSFETLQGLVNEHNEELFTQNNTEISERTEKEQERGLTIYQLKSGEDNRDRRWESYESLLKQGEQPNLENYQKVYNGSIEPSLTLEDIYEEFTINKPTDFKGHSLTVSDIVVTKTDDTYAANYVNNFGYVSCPEFAKQHEQKNTTTIENVVDKEEIQEKQLNIKREKNKQIQARRYSLER